MSKAERRRSPRQPILDSFSLFIVLPKKGMHRLQVHDVSALGIGFDLDIEGESPEDFPIAVGETVELQFYLNQSLYLPLTLRITRIDSSGAVRRAGGEIQTQDAKAQQAFLSFVQMLESISSVARLQS